MQSGIIIINKPTGITSRFVVDKVGKALGTKKIGHTGTLDPLAEGLLIITVGQATKLVDFLSLANKEYQVEMELGYLTDTLDSTGKVLGRSEKIVSEKQIVDVVSSFQREYMQQVPIYSAVKINGRKCYEYARDGITVELPEKLVNIKLIKDIKIKEKTISFTCQVSKGTYIRSLVRDIGEALGTYATMTKLVRTSQSNYQLNDADNIEGPYHIINIEDLFKSYNTIELDMKTIENGMQIDNNLNLDYVRVTVNQKVVGIYQKNYKDTSKLKPLIIFKNT